MKPEMPDSQHYANDSNAEILANAVMDWLYSDLGPPRSSEEANLCNWANYILEGEHYEPFDLSKLDSHALYEKRKKN